MSAKQPTKKQRLAEANAQSRKAQIRPGGPGSLIATYSPSATGSEERARAVRDALRAKGWIVVMDRDFTLVATADYSE
jgi:hypothetical protein